MIPAPYLLYLGGATDEIQVKTSRGVAVWRPERCIGQHRHGADVVSLGLPDMSFEAAFDAGARTLILGVANHGGSLGPETVRDVLAALEAGLNVAAGLHDRLINVPAIRQTAEARGLQLFDVRDPPEHLPVGNGDARPGRRILTVGTDCSVGKMYTSLALERELRARGLTADFRATGQTGILIAGSGIPIDAVVADFISGGAEVVSPARHDGGWDIIEGQGSLFHPSYAGVSLGLLHGAQPDALILCHEPTRPTMRGLGARPLPDLRTCLEVNLQLARLTSPAVIATGVSLNTSKLGESDAQRLRLQVEDELGLPCEDPMRTGVARIADRLVECFDL